MDQWDQYFQANNITDPDAMRKMRERYSSPKEYEDSAGITGRTNTTENQVDLNAGSNQGSNWEPEGWRSDTFGAADEYIRGNVDAVSKQAGEMMGWGRDVVDKGGAFAPAEDAIAGQHQENITSINRSGQRNSGFADAARLAEGNRASSAIGQSRMAGTQAGWDVYNRGAAMDASARMAGSGQFAGMSTSYFNLFDQNSGGGGMPWHSKIGSMSGDRNPLASDYQTWDKSKGY